VHQFGVCDGDANDVVNVDVSVDDVDDDCEDAHDDDVDVDNGEVEYVKMCGREDLIVYWNHTELHSNKKLIMVESKALLSKVVIDKVKQGKKVAVPTGSSKYAHAFERALLSDNPDLKIKIYTAKTHDGSDPVGEWGKYDVVIFSPCVAAGNSFVELYFNCICAYFPAVGCGPEFADQMIFRVRNCLDNEIYLCVETQGAHSDIPANSLEEMKAFVMKKDAVAHSDIGVILIQGFFPIKINLIEDTLDTKDPYFHMYSSVLYDIHQGKKKYIPILLAYLRMMRVKLHSVIDTVSLDENGKEELKNIRKILKESYIE
jgi:hypothetical protein